MTAIREAIYVVCAEQHPVTVRGIFYQLVSQGVIAKTENEYNATVIRLVKAMRLEGDLPWEWVVDGSRWTAKAASYDSMQDALENTARFYRREMWSRQPAYIEVWSEKATILGMLEEVTADFDIPLMVVHGFSSITFLHETAQVIRAKMLRGKDAVIMHLGDHDPSGVRSWKNIQNRLSEFTGTAPTFQRIAVTPQQIESMRLPMRPTKDSKHSKGWEGDSVEVDAIPAPALKEILRTAIEGHIDADEWERVKLIEQAERRSVPDFLKRLPAIGHALQDPRSA